MLSLLTVLLVASLFLTATVAAKKAMDMDAYNKRTGAKYLAEIAKKESVVTLKSGMLIEVITPSSARNAVSPTLSDTCDVTYSGTFKDGKSFDAGKTKFAPNQVIKGWTEAMQYMVEGDKWKLHIPFDLAYGERGSPPKIPGYSVLVFEIEIHKVLGKGKTPEEANKMLRDNTVPRPQAADL